MASTQKKTKRKQQGEQKHSLKDLKTLGNQLLSSRAHINNLSLLLTYVSPNSPPQHVLECLLSLQPFFTTVLPEFPPKAVSSAPNSKMKNKIDDDEKNRDPEFIYFTWLRARFDEFINLLLDFVVSPLPEEPLKEIVLDALMEFLKLGSGGRFQSTIYHKLLRGVVHAETPLEFITDLLASKYFKYIDVRYFTYISLEKLAATLEAQTISDENSTGADSDNGLSKTRMDVLIHKIHCILSQIPPQEGQDEKFENNMWSESGILSYQGDSKELSMTPKADHEHSKTENHNNNILSAAKIMRKMKLKFTKAWISFLRLPLPLDAYKEVLVSLHQSVIPYISNPIMLSDFLTRSYDIGGVVSVMALSSLFILMTQHGLEYPDFYEKLYALLVPSIFLAKHRARFFELLDSCLKSALLPAYLAAAFTKRLSRLALSAPPSGAIVIIALIHNLLRRHPSINFLVHREDDNGTDQTGEVATGSTKPGIDHFSEESKPIKSNAMKSSLWEIDTLRHHYCPAVSRFVLSLENDLTVRAKTTELDIKDFSSGSYATVFGDEMRRRVKQVPTAIYKTGHSSLFSESDFPGWTFNKENNMVDGEQNASHTSHGNSEVVAKRQRVKS